MSTNKATLIFTGDNDGSLSIQITFDPEQPNMESNAHIAAILAHQYIVKKVDEAYEDEPTE
jgi:hypothetical protein